MFEKKMQPPPLISPRPPDWGSRNWKWFVPTACVALVAVIFGFVFSVMAFMRSSDAYAGAVARAKASPSVIDAVGSPIKEGLIFTGHINVAGASGKADLAIPIEGPKGKATIYVDARKSAGQWHFDQLVVQIASDQRRIDISER